ncbi:DUF547 domain-containing protein [Erythrobacter litoralis]|uniref:DUF547 domain-containing protein n=1 Tax=Erythrobacter litoralis (strain HTCC2594) TaxID=314225 RepID=Q2N8K9_ERYLH|nr:DUF547 domain-containing protein [Erythrobacter litoralis]ABC63982.1 hypothetical protein ELI_09450 [Erythrobacter litoralis HTCC2594]
MSPAPRFALGFALALSVSAPALAQSDGGSASATVSTAEFARFTPGAQAVDTRLDYSIWNEALDYMVFRMRSSARDVPPPIRSTLGTRMTYGHDSLYRLEGNRILFSFLEDEIKQSLVTYREELAELAGTIDIAGLPRNEQLAYWINLHNAAVISKIAEEYPVKAPARMKVGPEELPLDEAKFITVAGVAMSPKDIRTKIVYPNWKDPRVIYGFFRGEIGGPSINDEAFTGANVGRLLDENAREFVNSLRGVEKRGNTMHVSKIFEEARPYFFNDWVGGLRAHVGKYAREDVTDILLKTASVEADLYEEDISDMAKGERQPIYAAGQGVGRVPPNVARLIGEYRQKVQKLIKRKELQPKVTVIDMNSPTEEGYVVE